MSSVDGIDRTAPNTAPGMTGRTLSAAVAAVASGQPLPAGGPVASTYLTQHVAASGMGTARGGGAEGGGGELASMMVLLAELAR